MRSLSQYKKHLHLIFTFILLFILTSCGNGNCNTSTTPNNPNPPIIKVLPDSGGATLTIPISRLTIPKGVTTTSTSISLTNGTPGLIIGLSSAVASSQYTALTQNILFEQPITITYNPESLIVNSIINSSMQITVNNSLPADTYNINIFASYIANNGSLMHIQVGTMSLSYAGGTPTPDPTPSPSPTPSPTPSPIPLAGVLTITPESLTLIPSQQGNLTLTLNNSAEINNLVVNVASESTGIASINSTDCTLSTTANICTLNVTGINFGNTTVTASARGYQPAISNIIIRNPWSQIGGNVTSAGYFFSIIQNESGDTYAGGYSLSTPNTAGVWMWNGNLWSQIGTNVESAVSFNSIIRNSTSGNIYAGAHSTSGYGGVWVWDGNSWSQLGSDVTAAYQFTTIIQESMTNDIYATGQATGLIGSGVWKWNGSSWSILGGGYVESANVLNTIMEDKFGNIYAAGSLLTGGGGVWIWNGSSWSQLGNKITSANLFSSIIQDNAGNIYVGGSSSNSRGGVWKWNGSTWTQLESSISSVKTFNSLTQDESGNIYAGGMTTGFNSLAVVWKWNGNSWSQLGSNVTSARNFTSILRNRIGNIYAGGATTSTVYGGLWVYTP